MTFPTYLVESAKTAKDLKENNLTHFILGMIGEYFSEVFTIDVLGKGNKEELVLEHGDFLWYFAGYCRTRNVPVHYTITKPGKFNTPTTEALGLLVEHEKKVLLGTKQFDEDHIAYLCTNIYHNINATLIEVGSNINECMQMNIEKLAKRYPQGTFNLEDAKNKIDQNG